MPDAPKILILDDDRAMLDSMSALLSRLPSAPEIHTSDSGSRALALLESEPFTVLLTDLNMPKVDGFQVLMLVRRKFPSLRTVVMTGVVDDQYRARAYAMGIDVYIEKPTNRSEIKFFTDCIESLLGQEEQGGFRGVQSKSLVDLIQLESLAQGTSVLKIVNGPVEGRVWMQQGDVIDAAVRDLTGEVAFLEILGWKGGSFEMLPGDPARARTIFASCQALLLNSAQTLDEAGAAADPVPDSTSPVSTLAPLARTRGVEFVLSVNADDKTDYKAWGVESPDLMAAWVQENMRELRGLGEKLSAGELTQIEAFGPQRHVGILARSGRGLCVGLERSLSTAEVKSTLKDIATKWAS